MRYLLTAIILLLSACGDDPVEYAWGWEHNILPEDLPKDCKKSISEAEQHIQAHGYEFARGTVKYGTAQTRDGIIVLDDSFFFLSCNTKASVKWHELVHINQFISNDRIRYGVPEWAWAYETQGYRQDVIVNTVFGYTKKQIDSNIEDYLDSLNDNPLVTVVDNLHFEISRAIFEDARDKFLQE